MSFFSFDQVLLCAKKNVIKIYAFSFLYVLICTMKWKESKYKDDDKNTNPSESMSYKKEPWRKSNTNLPLTAAPADLSTMLNGSLS